MYLNKTELKIQKLLKRKSSAMTREEKKALLYPGYYRMGEKSLLEIVKDSRNSKIISPTWQRALVWPEKKQEEFKETIDLANEIRQERDEPVFYLPGVLYFFRLKDEGGSILKVNDGMNRIRTVVNFYEELEATGLFSRYDLEEIFSRIKFNHQEWEFENIAQAQQFYRLINAGTPLTTFDMSMSHLTVTLPLFEENWKPILGTPDIRMPGQISLICQTARESVITKPLDMKSKTRRVDLSLLYRFINDDNSLSDYKAGAEKSVFDDNCFEFKLGLFLTKNYTDSKKRDELVRSFQTFVTRHVALINEAKATYCPGFDKYAMPTSCLMFLLHLFAFCEKRNIGVERRIEFLKDFFKRVKEYNYKISVMPDFFNKETEMWEGKLVFGGGDISSPLVRASRCIKNEYFLKLCQEEGFGTEEKAIRNPNRVKKVRSKKPSLAPGYDHSHYIPFSEHGDGETFVEPSIINQSRGAKPVEFDEEGFPTLSSVSSNGHK